MKRHCSVALVAVLALPCMACLPVAALRSSRTNPRLETKDAIDRWARENYGRAIDLAFQDRCTSPIDARWLSCIRIVPAYRDEIEYSLSVERRHDGMLFAQIVRPKAQSVYTQLCKHKKERPHASLADLTKLIELESQAGDQRRFPALAALADDFEKIRFSPVLPDEIMMDATQYRFRMRSSSGDQMELTLGGPGAAAPHQPQVLIQWAESARQILASAFH